MNVYSRREHLKNSKRRRTQIFQWSGDLRLPQRKKFRNWMRHPISNVIYWWWGNVWHKPKMVWEVATFGEIDHAESEADYAVIGLSCKRCGWEDQDSIIQAFPKYTDEIMEFLVEKDIYES